MNATLQPPPVPVPTRAPQRRRPLIGRFTKFMLAVLAIALLVRLFDLLHTAEGRRLLWDGATTLLLSPETYIALPVIVVNALLCALIILYLYPTSRATLRGLGKAVVLVKGDEFHKSQGGEIRHFFMIFIFPSLVLQAGIVEYQWLKAWLLP